MPTPRTFTGEMIVDSLDALTVAVKLSHLPGKETRVVYLRLISNMEPRSFDQCAYCMERSYSKRVTDDGITRVLESIGRGRTLVVSIEPFKPGEFCKRCTDHLNFTSFTSRLLGDTP